MKLLIRLAWRNIFRNKRRTILSGIAVGIGLASLMFVDAMLVGMFESMIRNATDTFMGQGQIHARGFRDTFEVERTISNTPAVLNSLEGQRPLISAYAPRTIAYGMLTSPYDVGSVMVYGIDSDTEATVSLLKRAIVEGQYLSTGNQRGILIGDRAAQTLGVSIGDKLVLTVAQAGTGELSQELFRVEGIFRFGIRDADGGLAYINISRAQQMLAIGGNAHEIALRFDHVDSAGNRSLPFWAEFSSGGNEALGWPDLIPQLRGLIEMSRASTAITILLVFGIVALTIMNTLFMSLYERMYEFGVLRAIGTRPWQMGAVIVIEAASLALASMVIGTAIGLAANLLIAHYGIDYTGIEFAGVTFTEPIYTVIRPLQFTLMPALIFLFSIVASIYPAFFAARLNPAKTMRRSL